MRSVLSFTCLWLIFASARGQEQEQKLVDRLLKPDTTLANAAQKKKFVADGASVDKQASVKSFYFEDKEKPRTFTGRREYHATGFDSRPFYAGRDRQTVSTHALNTPRTTYRTWIASASRSHDSDKATATYEYRGQRPFLDHGKSEKSLQRQNPPMTIEQVRELLNKNR